LPGLRKLALGPGVWKDLAITYEILSRIDGRDDPRIAVAYERFVEQAAADDPDLPTARKILEQTRAAQREMILRRRRTPIRANSEE